jgi:aminoglycoside phosphotransferase (APT) family kinase protein
LLDELAEHPTTIVHGDLHLDNVIITPDGPTILDWAGVCAGPAATDLAHCFVEVLDVDPRSDVGRSLIDRYLERLQKRGVTSYPVDDLDDAIRIVHQVAVAGNIRWAVNRSPEPGTRPWHLLRHTLARYDRLLTE